jgi:kexin
LAVQTSLKFNDNDPSWQSVAMGRVYSHLYGFGKLDAYRIVTAAQNYSKVNGQTYLRSPVIWVNSAIPKTSDGIQSTYTFRSEYTQQMRLKRLEHVTVTVTATHEYRGNVEIQLISPNGYWSILATSRPFDSSTFGFKNWTMMTVKHW